MQIFDYLEEILYSILAIPLFVMSLQEIKEDLKHNHRDSRLRTDVIMAIIFGILTFSGIFILISEIIGNR